jgi:hypothetical protein
MTIATPAPVRGAEAGGGEREAAGDVIANNEALPKMLAGLVPYTPGKRNAIENSAGR